MIIVSTSYLPSADYISKITRHDRIIIETKETFPRQTHRNRCYISTANGKLRLSIPVTKPNGTHTVTGDVLLAYREKWQMNHWRAIETAYSSSPFFVYYMDGIRPYYDKRFEKLVDFNSNLLSHILDIIGFDINLTRTEKFHTEYPGVEDFRSACFPVSDNKEITFKRYPQVFEERSGFVPGMSILDLLFNLGPATKDYISGM